MTRMIRQQDEMTHMIRFQRVVDEGTQYAPEVAGDDCAEAATHAMHMECAAGKGYGQHLGCQQAEVGTTAGIGRRNERILLCNPKFVINKLTAVSVRLGDRLICSQI